LTALAGTLGIATLLLCGRGLPGQQPPPDRAERIDPGDLPQQEGVDVLARGPVHEAFAEPTIRSPRESPVVTKQPPDPIEELPPDQKVEGALWIPGYWAWDEDRGDFIWVSGIWRVPPPDRYWVPGHWDRVQDGWQWVPGYWGVTTQEDVQYLPAPPDPIAESPPPQPDNDSIYVPGCWVFRDTRYLWRPGFWHALRPGWLWVAASYAWTPAGYVFVNGYWDYPFADRGLLFAPVAIDRRFLGQANWFYQPRYVVSDNSLLGSLFVRLANCHYYFGDYYGADYDRAGFIPWVDYRMGRYAFDPIYSYYRWSHREDPRWERDLRSLYVGRARGEVERPPQTLVQQAKLVQNNRTINVNTFNNIAILRPLNQVARSNTAIKLQAVNRTQVMEERKAAQHFRELSQHRGQVEAQLLSKGEAPLQTDRPHLARFETTTPRPAVRGPARAKAPPPPELPRFQTEARPGERPAPRPAARPNERPEPRPETRPNERPEPRRPARPAERPEPRREPRQPERPAPKPEPRPEPKAEPRRGERPEPRPEPKAEPRRGERPEPRPEPKAEPRRGEQPEPKPAARPATKKTSPEPPRERPADHPAPERPNPPPRDGHHEKDKG
jgi:hypothetical protein